MPAFLEKNGDEDTFASSLSLKPDENCSMLHPAIVAPWSHSRSAGPQECTNVWKQQRGSQV